MVRNHGDRVALVENVPAGGGLKGRAKKESPVCVVDGHPVRTTVHRQVLVGLEETVRDDCLVCVEGRMASRDDAVARPGRRVTALFGHGEQDEGTARPACAPALDDDPDEPRVGRKLHLGGRVALEAVEGLNWVQSRKINPWCQKIGTRSLQMQLKT